MKHLLNNLSEEEKNSIREQHEGGMTLDTSRFRTLLENKLGNAKPLVEQEEDDFGYASHSGDFDGDDSEYDNEKPLNSLQRHFLKKLESNPNIASRYGMSDEEFKDFVYNEIDDDIYNHWDEDEFGANEKEYDEFNEDDSEDELMEMSDDEAIDYLKEIIEFCEDKLSGYDEESEDEEELDLGEFDELEEDGETW
jgi:hypothetical protein